MIMIEQQLTGVGWTFDVCVDLLLNAFCTQDVVFKLHNKQVRFELIEKTSQDASDGWFQIYPLQSAACWMIRASEKTWGQVLIQ